MLSFEDVAVCNHELFDKLSEFDGELMAFFFLIGFREEVAEWGELFEAGANIQGLVSTSCILIQGSSWSSRDSISGIAVDVLPLRLGAS